jgi:GrpB-like predicted nucleotidyltransferase (UPF0157 family)
VPVTLVERYNPGWPAWFTLVAAYLEPHLAVPDHTIEHVGSTSIDGMTTKPIIDLVIVVGSGTTAEARAPLQAAGYIYRGDQGIPGRDVYRAVEGQPAAALPSHHLYVCATDAYDLRKVRVFQAFMRAHSEWRERLSAWKWRLAEQLEDQRQPYIDGKDAMMREIMRYAWQEAGVHPAPGDEPRTDEIAAFLETYPAPVPEMAASVRGMVRRVLPNIQETLDSASRIVAYGYGPGYGDTICTLIPSKTGVRLGIVGSASLPDPEALLSGSGKVHRVIAFARPADLGTNRPGKEALLERALAAWQQRSAARPAAGGKP